MRGLYVHIPFCKRICTYCDFCKRIAKDEKMIWDYLTTLKEEYNTLNQSFDTIFIGGGTPSLLNLEQLEFLFNIFKDQKPIEYTIEVNPETYTKEKGLLFKTFGINRISLGVQTFKESILKILNRGHKNDDVFMAINHLNDIGLNNISIDLIFALPNQTLEDVKKDLDIVKDLKIKHISYYSLILEEKTVLYHKYQQGLYQPQSSDEESFMFELIIKELKGFGFKHYEVSNFAKEHHFISLHNTLYWSLMPYEAIGAGAYGFNGKERYYHSRNVTSYTKYPLLCIENQSDYELYQDYLIFGLRRLEGINITKTIEQFGRNPLDDFPKLHKFIEEAFLIYENDYLKVSDKGLFLLNMIVEEFV